MAENLVKLISSDYKLFTVEEAVAMESELVYHLIKVQRSNETIRLKKVSGDTLEMVLKYCEYHAESQKSTEDKPATPPDEIKAWDAEFVKVDHETLAAILLAAHQLKIKNLEDLISKTFADMIKGKAPEQVRETFGITNDYTPKEEADYRKEYAWAFQE